MALQVLYRQRSHLVAEPDPLISFMYVFFLKLKLIVVLLLTLRFYFFFGHQKSKVEAYEMGWPSKLLLGD